MIYSIRLILISVIFFVTNTVSFSQVKVGEWREHFSYRKTSCVADAGDKVYVAGELAVFSFDKEDGSIERLSKVNGLSDAEIQTIAFNKANNSLVIAYKNSNIDILKDNIIYNLSDIKRKQISHSKTINKITFIGNTAYLSCGFGIVLLNTEKLEFSDTYIIGENASYLNINDISLFNNNLYAATDIGLYYADINEGNLSDYRNWHLVTNIPDYQYKINILNSFNGNLFANQINPATDNDTLYFLNNNNWNIFNENFDNIKSVTNTENNIVITQKGLLKIYDTSFNLVKTVDWYPLISGVSTWTDMRFGITDENLNIFIADNLHGLVQTNFGYFESSLPDGPSDNYTAKAETFNGTLITTNGNNKATGWRAPVYNIFKDEMWETYGISNDTAMNFFSIEINPNNPDNVFIGSWGYGIFEFDNNVWTKSYNNTNSSLQAISGYDYGFIRISDLTFDNNNNLWVANQHTGEPISVKTKDNEWQSFNFNGSITNYYPEEIITTQNNTKWVVLGESKGILAFNDNNTPLDKNDDDYKLFSPVTSEGEPVSNTIFSVEEDKSGNIWVGTGEGVVIYYNPDDVFTESIYADRIQLTSYGNDTTEQYLLSTDVITDIETDGADRKWIATQNSGVFLVSDNGKEEIHNFNKYNSPLISNSINDIAINHKSGEVFFLTDKGMMSYRSDATKAGETFGNVYVFPNPVRPDYSGLITVTGLADDVNVKFTDISGNVVFETNSLGGQAIWNGQTFNGRKVSSGVYLVYSTNDDGSQTFLTKLLFLN
ncbi:MAG: T9SS type A sorting domain-containing protein [Bacteroidales bacterium]|nr:T9SS type A sorting domain-containing protein [Bacteroidales bacterium]